VSCRGPPMPRSGPQAQPPTALADQTPRPAVPTPTSFSPRCAGPVTSSPPRSEQRRRELRTTGAAMSTDGAISYALADIDPNSSPAPSPSREPRPRHHRLGRPLHSPRREGRPAARRRLGRLDNQLGRRRARESLTETGRRHLCVSAARVGARIGECGTDARHPAPRVRRPTRRNGRASSITSGTPRCVGEYESCPGSRLPRGVRPVATRSRDSVAG
jgi:hypothetical protein